ncbi:uncharacterized protein MELLADRAFT_93589 [Melampsora larici-populina 98AG31]|uniref:Alpha-type protein kinase domain-containing protein n=1 Tax=Melampsora larici-populina (strain 98AG31 / pathotype 3-4-7) TaxID=747676 RepID=F4RAY6_MELLP|nr:uncharacterized protein MELLADRAFT_93589 [Melampsora larici-populina 98AG31]EGG10697.1 hypothetical protein MELLADRAFT_93589 [Melampsora larici-populina 98AG31]
MAPSIPNPDLDSPLCRCCGEDYPGRNTTRLICDPCQWNKDNPTGINKMVPCLFCSAQFEVLNTRLCGRCKKNPKAVAFLNQASGPDLNPASCPSPAKSIMSPNNLSSQHCFISPSKTSITSSYQPLIHSRSSLTSSSHTLAPLALNTATPASAHYGMQVENSVQRAIAQANELQSRQRQLQISNYQRGAVPYPSNPEARGSARSKMKRGLESKQQKTTGFIKINLAYILNSELIETELIGSSFDYDLSKTHWMLDLTTEVCDYFRDHPTFPSPQQVSELELHSLPPYYKDWYYLGELGRGNCLPNWITKNYLCCRLTSGRACEKFVLIYDANQYLTSTGKRNVANEVLDLPIQSSACPQSMSLRSHSMKRKSVHKSSAAISSDSESSVVLQESNNSNSIDDLDYTPRPKRALNVKRPKSNMQSIETRTSPPTVLSKATQTFSQVIDDRVDILCPEPLHQVMNKLIDDSPGGERNLPIVTKAQNCLSPSWKLGSMLTIITKDLDSNNINLHAIEQLTFEKSEVVYSVDRSAFIGSGAFMNCYEAKVLIDGQAQEMVAKQELDANMTLESYQALAQRYLEAERSINMFKMAIEANSGNIPYNVCNHCDKIRNFIVHRGHTDDPGPKEIYLFEEKIKGKFVKYFGNLFFSIDEEKENKTIYQIMHTLSHKTYHDNHGRWMISDLQGNEEGLLTDMAIIDQEYPWTMGNTNRLGLIGFRLTAKCNFLCKKLGLPDPRSARYPKVVNGMVGAGTESEFLVLDSDAERSWELLCGARTLST